MPTVTFVPSFLSSTTCVADAETRRASSDVPLLDVHRRNSLEGGESFVVAALPLMSVSDFPVFTAEYSRTPGGVSISMTS
jgi:hypothetical protein